MTTFLALIIITILLALIFMYDDGLPDCVIQKSSYGDEYCITDINTNTADILSRLNADIVYFLYCLKYNGGKYTQEQKGIVAKILKNYNPDNIIENPPYGKDTSYTIGKGKVLALCVRSNKKSHPVEYNTLMYVCLHEITHLGVEEHGHNEEFTRAFDFILEEAIRFGVYKYVNYALYPAYYCNMIINS